MALIFSFKITRLSSNYKYYTLKENFPPKWGLVCFSCYSVKFISDKLFSLGFNLIKKYPYPRVYFMNNEIT